MKNEKGYQERQILFTTGTRAALEQNIGMTRQNMKEIGPRAFPNVLIYAGNFSHAEKKRIESALSIGTSTGTKIEIYLANYLENEDQRKALLRILKPLIKERTEQVVLVFDYEDDFFNFCNMLYKPFGLLLSKEDTKNLRADSVLCISGIEACLAEQRPESLID